MTAAGTFRSDLTATRITFLRQLLRETGWWNSAVYLITRLASRLIPHISVNHCLLVAQPVPAHPGRWPTRRGGLVVREVAQTDYREDWIPRPKANIDWRFRQGATCLVAFEDDQPVGCIWLKAGAYLEDEVRCRFVPLPAGGAMWDFDVYVAPTHRGTRVFSQLWTAAEDWARSRDIRWTFSRIDAFNLGSIRAHRRLGARVVGKATFIARGDLQISILPAKPFLQLSRTHVPEVRLNAPESP